MGILRKYWIILGIGAFIAVGGVFFAMLPSMKDNGTPAHHFGDAQTWIEADQIIALRARTDKNVAYMWTGTRDTSASRRCYWLALLLVPMAFIGHTGSHAPAQWGGFWAISAGVAVVASILGNAFWNRASRLLPLTLTGQMIVFETLFALLYAFAWQQRWPTLLEALAIVFLVAGIVQALFSWGPDDSDVSVFEGFWLSFVRSLDPGTFGGDTGTIAFDSADRPLVPPADTACTANR